MPLGGTNFRKDWGTAENWTFTNERNENKVDGLVQWEDRPASTWEATRYHPFAIVVKKGEGDGDGPRGTQRIKEAVVNGNWEDYGVVVNFPKKENQKK